MYVYFVRATTLGLVKIGRASDPEQRFSSLQTGSPDKLELLGVIYEEEAEALERRLHVKYQDSRRHGEWFDPDPRLLAFIEETAFTWREECQRLIYTAYDLMGLRAGPEKLTRAAIREVLARLDAHQVVPVVPRVIEREDKAYPRGGRKAALARYKLARGL